MAKDQKLTAAQRIEGLEGQVIAALQNNQVLAGEIDNLRQTMTALARRLNATIKSGEAGSINNDSVNQMLVDENTQELKGKIDFLVTQGVLENSKSGLVGSKSFVVGRELDEEKNVINPRIQFALASIIPEVKDLLLGKKVGDVVKNEKGDGLLLEVTEIFDIVERIEKDFSEISDEA